MGTKKYLAEIIGIDEIESWEHGDIILISAPTGSGKSHFAKNILYEHCKQQGKKILYLLPRINVIAQFKKEIDGTGKNDIISIKSYQSVERNGHDFDGADYIVADEAHYFWSDAEFNKKTDVSFERIMNSAAQKIFMTATPNRLLKYMEENDIPVRQYAVDAECHINKVSFYQTDEDLDEMLKFASESGNKVILFVNDAKRGYELYKKYEAISAFNCSSHNKRYSKYRSEAEMQKLAETGKMNMQFLITTTALDVGFNITDGTVNNIIIDGVSDADTIIQCVGRRRKLKETDQVYLYVREFDNKFLRGRVYSLNGQIRMARYFEEHTLQKYINMYERLSDKSDIIYDYLDDNQTLQKAVNKLRLSNIEYEIAELKTIMQHEGHSFCQYITKRLGLSDYHMYDEKRDEKFRLENYLKSIIGQPFYTNAERQPIIEAINIRRKSKLLKSAKLINAAFEEMKMGYRICVYATRKRKEGRIYKNVWKVVVA